MTYKLVAFEVSLELAEAVQPLVLRLQRRDRNLADQLSRASKSVCLNVAEASRRAGRDRVNRFRIASGEAEEVRAALRLAVACQQLSAEHVQPALKLVDRVAKLLYGLIR